MARSSALRQQDDFSDFSTISPIDAILDHWANRTSAPTRVYFPKGVEFIKQGRLDDALICFQQAIIEDMNDVDAHAIHAWVLNDLHRYEDSLHYFEIAREKFPENPFILAGVGKLLATVNRFDEAIQVFDKALKIEPSLVFCEYWKYRVIFAQDKFEEAIEGFQAIKARYPAQSDRIYVRQSIYFLAFAYVVLERFEQAFEATKDAIFLYPDYAPSYVNLGQIFNHYKQPCEAFWAYGIAAELDPTQETSINLRDNTKGIVDNMKFASQSQFRHPDQKNFIAFFLDFIKSPYVISNTIWHSQLVGTFFDYLSLKESSRVSFYSMTDHIAHYLDEQNVPLTLWAETRAEFERIVRKKMASPAPADRPLWDDRHKDEHKELAGLSAPEFLKKVWADQIAPDGSIEKVTIRKDDAGLMTAIESYLAARKRRNQDPGDAVGLHFIALEIGPKRVKTTNPPSL